MCPARVFVGVRNLLPISYHVKRESHKALSGPDEFSEFYARLKSIRERHRKNVGEVVEPMSLGIVSVEDSVAGELTGTALVKFSGEEGVCICVYECACVCLSLCTRLSLTRAYTYIYVYIYIHTRT